MHVARAVGRHVVADGVEIVSETAFKPLGRALNIENGQIHPFLGNDFGIARAVGVYREVFFLRKKTERVAGECLRFFHGISSAPGQARNL